MIHAGADVGGPGHGACPGGTGDSGGGRSAAAGPSERDRAFHGWPVGHGGAPLLPGVRGRRDPDRGDARRGRRPGQRVPGPQPAFRRGRAGRGSLLRQHPPGHGRGGGSRRGAARRLHPSHRRRSPADPHGAAAGDRTLLPVRRLPPGPAEDQPGDPRGRGRSTRLLRRRGRGVDRREGADLPGRRRVGGAAAAGVGGVPRLHRGLRRVGPPLGPRREPLFRQLRGGPATDPPYPRPGHDPRCHPRPRGHRAGPDPHLGRDRALPAARRRHPLRRGRGPGADARGPGVRRSRRTHGLPGDPQRQGSGGVLPRDLRPPDGGDSPAGRGGGTDLRRRGRSERAAALPQRGGRPHPGTPRWRVPQRPLRLRQRGGGGGARRAGGGRRPPALPGHPHAHPRPGRLQRSRPPAERARLHVAPGQPDRPVHRAAPDGGAPGAPARRGPGPGSPVRPALRRHHRRVHLHRSLDGQRVQRLARDRLPGLPGRQARRAGARCGSHRHPPGHLLRGDGRQRRDGGLQRILRRGVGLGTGVRRVTGSARAADRGPAQGHR